MWFFSLTWTSHNLHPTKLPSSSNNNIDIRIVWTILFQVINIEVEGDLDWGRPCVDASIFAYTTMQDPCPCVDDSINGNEGLIN